MKEFFTREVGTSLVVLLIGLIINFLIRVIIRKLFNFKKMKDSKKRTIINLIVNIIRFVVLIITTLVIL